MCAPWKRFCKGRVRSVNGEKNAIDKSDRRQNEKCVSRPPDDYYRYREDARSRAATMGTIRFRQKIKPTVSANIQKGSIPVSVNLPARIEKRQEPMTVIIPGKKGLYYIQTSFKNSISKTNK